MVNTIGGWPTQYQIIGNAGPQSPGLNSVQPGLAGSDADGFLDVGYEDLAVADAPGLGGAADGVDGSLDQIVADHDLDFDLGKEVNDVFGAAIKLGVTFLAPEAFGLRNGDALQSYFLERLLHFVELERLDDSFDLLHRAPPGHFERCQVARGARGSIGRRCRVLRHCRRQPNPPLA